MGDGEDITTWLESRRLIISKLSGLETDLRDYGLKVERVLDVMRQRHADATEKMSAQLAELRTTISMMEMKFKVWSTVIGLLASGAVTVITHFVTNR
jgi:hypothetical protein